MNLYISLRQHPSLAAARQALVEKSKALLLKNWLAQGHVLENYNAETGDNRVTEGKMGMPSTTGAACSGPSR